MRSGESVVKFWLLWNEMRIHWRALSQRKSFLTDILKGIFWKLWKMTIVLGLLWTEWYPPNSYIEALPPVWLYLELGLLRRYLRLKKVIRVGAEEECPYQKRKRHKKPLSPHGHSGKTLWGHGKKAGFHKPGGENSPKINSDATLILTF